MTIDKMNGNHQSTTSGYSSSMTIRQGQSGWSAKTKGSPSNSPQSQVHEINGISNGNGNGKTNGGPPTRSIRSASSSSSDMLLSPSKLQSHLAGISHRSKQARVSGANRKKKSWSTSLIESVESTSFQMQMQLERQFRKHGRRIARHPVHTLLIACLIITSLFYPAVGIYLWSSKGGPGVTRGDARSVWRSLSTPLLDSFASSGRKHQNSLRDLRMIWDDAPDLRAIDARDASAHLGSPSLWHIHGDQDQVAKSPRGICQSIRMEHVFITTDEVTLGLGPRFGSLHVPILKSALILQQTIESIIGSNQGAETGVPRCIKEPDSNRCLILSPLSYWSNDKEKLNTDQSPTTTILGTTLNHTLQGIPLSLLTTLAGRSHLFQHLPRADHLALTFFLQDEQDCNIQAQAQKQTERNLVHEAWSGMLRNITGNQVSLLGSDWQSPKEIVLQFTPRHPQESFPTQKVLLAVGYIAMVVWLTRSLLGVKNVHSTTGLAFTACVELTISMTLAISICALSGVRLTLIPWEILPFVIVVIGSENMFALTNAIISSPTSLSVSSRLANGFHKAGMPIAVTIISDVLLMSVIAILVDVQAVREFCIFAIFALIVDFFMQFSFYATVLSIDMQRLELADLLEPMTTRKNPIGGDDESIHSDSATALDEGTFRSASFIKTSCRAAWRARTARTASLSLLLAFMAGIYLYHSSGYTSSLSYPFSVSDNEREAWSGAAVKSATFSAESSASASSSDQLFDPYSHLGADEMQNADATQFPTPWWHSSPSAKLWQLLNPNDASIVQVKIEPWVVVSLPSATRQNVGKRNFASWTIFRPRVRAIIWFAKLVVLPIAGTTALLWVLLLYLLKDTELLDAKWDPNEHEDEDVEATRTALSKRNQLEVQLTVCSDEHSSDIVHFVRSGPFIASISENGMLQLVRMSKRSVKIKMGISLRQFTSSIATSLAINSNAGTIAVGHANGTISLLSTANLEGVCISDEENRQSSRIVYVQFTPQDGTASPKGEATSLISIHRNGAINLWKNANPTPIRLRKGDENELSSIGLPVSVDCKDSKKLFAISRSDGGLEVFEFANDSFSPPKRLFSGASIAGLVKSVCWINHHDSDGQFVAIGTTLGKIQIFDVTSGALVDEKDIQGGAAVYSIRSICISEAAETVILLVAMTSIKSTIFSFTSPTSNGSPPNGNALQLNVPSPSLRSPTLEKRPSILLLPDKAANATASIKEEAANGIHQDLKLKLLGEIQCRRGGADVVAEGQSAILLGVRRKQQKQQQIGSSSAEASRWEAYSLDLKQVITASLSEGNLEGKIQRGTVLLDDRGSINNLSFTRLSKVEAYYRFSSSSLANAATTTTTSSKSNLLIAFGNAIAIVSSQSDGKTKKRS